MSVLNLKNACADGHNQLSGPDRNYCEYLLACYWCGVSYHDGQCSRLYRLQCLASSQLRRDYAIGDPDEYLSLLTRAHRQEVKRKACDLLDQEIGNVQREKLDEYF